MTEINGNNVGFLNRLLLSKEGVKLLENGADIKELLSESFDSELIILKVIFILLFIVCAVVNKYLDFIKSHPVTFGIETAIYGIAGAIPFLYMETYRKGPDDKKNYLTMFIVMFLLYCFFNVILEIGGIYSWLYEEDEHKKHEDVVNNKTKHQLLYDGIINSMFLTVLLVIVYMILLLFLSTFKVFDFNINQYQNNFYLAFILETFIFSLFNSIPFFLVAYNREGSHFDFKKNAIEVSLLFVKFIIFHLLLQGSGFYKHSLGY